MTTDNDAPVATLGVSTITHAAIDGEIEMLRGMLESPGDRKDRDLDSIRGQIGVLRKIRRGEFPSKRAARPVVKLDPEAGQQYGGT